MRTDTLARHRRPGSARHRHRAFTFMEILFAVMILGIGFIMLAAMFPAALRQTQQNVEENEFNAVAHIGARDLENLALNTDPRWPAFVKTQQAANGGQPVVGSPSRWMDILTGWVVNFPDGTQAPIEYDPVAANQTLQSWGRPIPWSFHDPRFATYTKYSNTPTLGNPGTPDPNVQPADALWDLVRGNMILADKKQNAWAALWARPQRLVNGKRVAAPSLQLFIFPLRSRAKAEYDPNAYVLGDTTGNKKNPSCDITYKQANLDPAIIGIAYYPPPATGAASNAPNGVLQLIEVDTGPGAAFALDATKNLPPAANPLAEGAYVVVSQDRPTGGAISMPAKYNGMIFKLGPEVADQNGALGTSGGQFWSVSDVINMPGEQPFNRSTPSSIEPNAFPLASPGSAVRALVFGRQPDPADPSQQQPGGDAIRASQPQPNLAPPRTGTAQELGYYPWSVIVQQ